MGCDHEALHLSVDENGQNPAIVCRYCDWMLGGFKSDVAAEMAIKMLELWRGKESRYLASWESISGVWEK